MLELEPDSEGDRLSWFPNSQLLAVCFSLRGASNTSANNSFVQLHDTSGACTATCLTRARRRAAASRANFTGAWSRGFEFSADSSLLAGIMGTDVVVLDVRDCSIVASLGLETLTRGPVPEGTLYRWFNWVPVPKGDLVLRVDTESVQTQACWSPVTRELSWSRAPLGLIARGAPVWGALGSAAGLKLVPGSGGESFEVCLWLPWTAVPRSSGVRSGGQVVNTGLRLGSVYCPDQLRFSPDGTLLAVAASDMLVRPGQAPEHNGLAIWLLHWRTGEVLQKVSLAIELAGVDLGQANPYAENTDLHLLGVMARQQERMAVEQQVSWSASGRAVHFGWHLVSATRSKNSLSANFVVVVG